MALHGSWKVSLVRRPRGGLRRRQARQYGLTNYPYAYLNTTKLGILYQFFEDHERERLYQALLITIYACRPKMRVVDRNVTWARGKALMFDDSFEHEVWYEPRVRFTVVGFISCHVIWYVMAYFDSGRVRLNFDRRISCHVSIRALEMIGQLQSTS